MVKRGYSFFFWPIYQRSVCKRRDGGINKNSGKSEKNIMNSVYISHYSEIGLKGKNRIFFENHLQKNIKYALKNVVAQKDLNIIVRDKRLIINIKNDPGADKIYTALSAVFGLANFAKAVVCASELSEIKKTVLQELAELEFESFVIRTKRANKSFPLNSVQTNIQIGAAVVDDLKKTVSLSTPDMVCHIEILKEETFIFAKKIEGPGGLPVGSSGRVTALLSGGFDSPVAAWYLLKRGARVDFVHFHSFPYTNAASMDKVKDLAFQLKKYQPKAYLFMTPFSKVQEEILSHCPDRYRIILYRRFMMRITERIARRYRSKALVTGESLGQVASQTLANMIAVNEVAKLPVLRPLIGLDKNEIMDTAREIGSYDISALPHDDACTRFMPKHPVIFSDLSEIREAEKALDIDELLYRSIKETERIEI
jgi:thiamine biosynthesis protein ThiI